MNVTLAQRFHDNDVIVRNTHISGAKELPESYQALFQAGAREGLDTRLVRARPFLTCLKFVLRDRYEEAGWCFYILLIWEDAKTILGSDL